MRIDQKTADRLLPEMSGTGAEGRARKLILRWRRAPSETMRDLAQRALAVLDEDRQRELRQVARV